MRWACCCRSVACPRRRTAAMRTVKSRGPDTPMLVSRAMRESALSRYGGQKARRTGEIAKQPSKPSRGECRVFSAEPVVTAACFFVAGGPWVRPAPGIPRASSQEEGHRSAKLGRESAPRGREAMSQRRHHNPTAVLAGEAKQSRVTSATLDCFVATLLAMTEGVAEQTRLDGRFNRAGLDRVTTTGHRSLRSQLRSGSRRARVHPGGHVNDHETGPGWATSRFGRWWARQGRKSGRRSMI